MGSGMLSCGWSLTVQSVIVGDPTSITPSALIDIGYAYCFPASKEMASMGHAVSWSPRRNVTVRVEFPACGMISAENDASASSAATFFGEKGRVSVAAMIPSFSQSVAAVGMPAIVTSASVSAEIVSGSMPIPARTWKVTRLSRWENASVTGSSLGVTPVVRA